MYVCQLQLASPHNSNNAFPFLHSKYNFPQMGVILFQLYLIFINNSFLYLSVELERSKEFIIRLHPLYL